MLKLRVALGIKTSRSSKIVRHEMHLHSQFFNGFDGFSAICFDLKYLPCITRRLTVDSEFCVFYHLEAPSKSALKNKKKKEAKARKKLEQDQQDQNGKETDD